MILNPSQAKAAYSTMCELNNVGFRMRTVCKYEDGSGVFVGNRDDGTVSVRVFDVDGETTYTENYPTQAAFAAAYNLE